MGQVFRNVFTTMKSGNIGNSLICSSHEKPMLPAGVEQEQKKIVTNQELQNLQKQADMMDLLLPSELNGNFGERKIKQDQEEDDNKLLPLIY